MTPNSKRKRSALCLIVATAVLGSGGVAVPQDSTARPLVILIGPPLSGKTTFVTSIDVATGFPEFPSRI